MRSIQDKLREIAPLAGINVDALPVSVREILRGVAPMMVYADGQALARMEWVPVEDSLGSDDAAQDF